MKHHYASVTIPVSMASDDEEKAELQIDSAKFTNKDIVSLWQFQNRSINAIAASERGIEDDIDLKNPYEGNPSARQLNESVNEFIRRVPVLHNPYVSWLWIANFKAGGQSLDEDARDLEPELIRKGLRLLNAFSVKKLRLESRHQGRTPFAVSKQLAADRFKLKTDLLRVATECRMVTGKWLLFPLEQDCPVVWEKVCYAVADGRLGIGAKIAAKSDGGPVRVGCIYTKNFNNEADIMRVVIELSRLNLLPKDEKRSIYYKCDAYTYLNIMSGNDYGLSASLYASRDVLPWSEEETEARTLLTTENRIVERTSPFD